MKGILDGLLPAERWRRNQIAVTLAAALIFFGFTLVLPFLPYFVASLGVSGKAVDVWSGVLLSVAPLLAALMAPFWGRMGQRTGMKLMLQRTLVAMVAHWLLMMLAGNVWHLLALRLMLGAFSGFGTISVALVTLGAPRERIGAAVGALQAAQILSAATGPFVGGILYELVGLRATFGVTASLCAVGLLLVSAAYTDHPETDTVPSAAGAKAPREGFRSVGRIPGVLPILVVLFWASAVSRSFGLTVPLFLKELALGSVPLGVVTGLTVSLGAFAEALSALLAGRLAARVNPRRLLLAGLAASLAAVIPMLFVHGHTSFLVLRVAHGLVSGGALTLCYTMGGAIFTQRQRAVAYSVLSSASMLGGAFGPTLGGVVSWGLGLRYNFLFAGAVYGSLALATLSGIRRQLAEAARSKAADSQSSRPPWLPLPR